MVAASAFVQDFMDILQESEDTATAARNTANAYKDQLLLFATSLADVVCSKYPSAADEPNAWKEYLDLVPLSEPVTETVCRSIFQRVWDRQHPC